MPKIIVTQTLGPNVVAGAAHNWNWNTIHNISQTYGTSDWFIAAQGETRKSLRMTETDSPTRRKLAKRG